MVVNRDGVRAYVQTEMRKRRIIGDVGGNGAYRFLCEDRLFCGKMEENHGCGLGMGRGLAFALDTALDV